MRNEPKTRIKCVPLGAGQDVGKSCVVVTVGGKNIMFDCGMHMGYQDERRYPKFSFLFKGGNYTQAITCVIITHFHLDHIGALPYFTEVCGYNGPIFMTYPTKALAPLMLEDYRKVLVDKKGEQEIFSVAQIQQCMKKVTAVDLKQTIRVDDDLEIRAYYAGHVLGAAMFYVKVGEESVVYTGDYNMTPDRHLGAAQIDPLQPDLLITESTYATTVRDSKRSREREFLKNVHTCVAAGGKVLIPVFALGRAQELCILLDEYWERMNLAVPIYFSAGLTTQANVYYKLLISWTNQKVKDTFVTRNTFDFKHVAPFDQTQIDAPGPCVLFATPGMLSGGLSLEVFRHWAPSEMNMVVVPGFCVAGTVGNKLMSGKPTKLEIDKRNPLDVRCQVHSLSFSAHTDAKGIMDLVKHVNPRHVVLVHGEKPKMSTLKSRIVSELAIPCFDPANHDTVEVSSRGTVKVSMSKAFVDANREAEESKEESMDATELGESHLLAHAKHRTPVEGVIILDDSSLKSKVLQMTEASVAMNVTHRDMTFSCQCPIEIEFCDGKFSEDSPYELQVNNLAGGQEKSASSDSFLPMSSRGNDGIVNTRHRKSSAGDTECPAKESEGRKFVSLTTSPSNEDSFELQEFKKRRTDAMKRAPSLNLEREPEIESEEELDSEGGRNLRTASTFSSSAKSQRKNRTSTSAGFSRLLDINVVPESSSEMEIEPPDSESSRPEKAPPSALSILRALHATLKGVTRRGSAFRHEGDYIKNRSFTLKLCSNGVWDPSHFEGGVREPISHPSASPGNRARRVMVAMFDCNWLQEDDSLACTVLNDLAQRRLKLP